MHYRTILISVAILLSSYKINAQVNTSSPYSRFGIGEIANQSLGRSFGMGGISTGLRLPFEINMKNPASYTAVPRNTFLFQVGMKSKRTDYSTVDLQATNYDFSLSSINAGLKVNKFWGMSFGLTPVSNIGYSIQSSDSVVLDDVTSNFENHYFGEGGISQLYLGNAFTYKGFSIGINTAYYFGTLSKRTESLMTDIGYNSLLLDNEDIKIKDFNIRYGFQYSDSIFKNYNLTIGGFFENKSDLNTSLVRFTKQTSVISGAGSVIDTLINDTINTGTIEMPMRYGAGFSFMTKQFIIGLDYEKAIWKDLLYFGNIQTVLTNSSKVSFGLEYTNDNASKEYFKTVNFRIGGYYGSTNLYLNDTQIMDAGLTFGFGIPTKVGTKINLGFGIGKRGTTDNNLIKENYYTINLNINMTDQWFVRRKFF